MNRLYDLITSGAISREEYEGRVKHYTIMKKIQEVAPWTRMREEGSIVGSSQIYLKITTDLEKYFREMPPEKVNLEDDEGNTLFLLVCQLSETHAMRMLLEIPLLNATHHNKEDGNALLFASILRYETLVMKILHLYPLQAFSLEGHAPIGEAGDFNYLEAICYHVMHRPLTYLLCKKLPINFHGEYPTMVIWQKSAFMWLLRRGGERMAKTNLLQMMSHPSFVVGMNREKTTEYLQEMFLVEYSRDLIEPLLLHYPANLMEPVYFETPERSLFDAVVERFPDLAPACIVLHGVPANLYHPGLDEAFYPTREAECAICMETDNAHFVTCGNERCGKTVHTQCWKEYLLSQQVRHRLDDRPSHHIERKTCVCCRDSDLMYFALP